MLINEQTLVRDCIQWDVKNWSQSLKYWQPILDAMNDKNNGRVLCLGERDGGLTLWFALLGFQVVCTDIYGITESARELHKSYNVSHRISYNETDIFKINFPTDYFDIVACKSVIGGLKTTYSDSRTRTLENQKLATLEINRVLKNGGFFLGAENLRGSPLHQLYRKKIKGKRIGWRHLSRQEVTWLFADYSYLKHRSFGFVGTFYKRHFVNSIGYNLDKLLSKILPHDWLYIDFIIAKK
ncbi:MAG: methyltransferase domain-containing protein [Cyclobacteriaceae bacterium]